jgi:purine-binding chemotaxis protein CheW
VTVAVGTPSGAPAPQSSTEPVGTSRHVLFQVRKERFALLLDAIREVVNPRPPFTRVPRTSDAVRGAMNLRGRVVAVVDLASLVGLPAQELLTGLTQVVILDRDKRTLGLLIGGVIGVESFAAPPVGEGNPLVRGVVNLRDQAVTVLDADGLALQAGRLFSGK